MIQLIDNYYLDRDEHNVILMERYVIPKINEITGKENKNAGKDAFRNQRYFPNIKDAIEKMVKMGFEKRMINSDVNSAMTYLDECVERIKEISVNLKF